SGCFSAVKVRFRFSPSISSSTTRQPSARNRLAVANPIPRADPVTSATFCVASLIAPPARLSYHGRACSGHCLLSLLFKRRGCPAQGRIAFIRWSKKAARSADFHLEGYLGRIVKL